MPNHKRMIYTASFAMDKRGVRHDRNAGVSMSGIGKHCENRLLTVSDKFKSVTVFARKGTATIPTVVII